jgi:Holliday junction resolvase
MTYAKRVDSNHSLIVKTLRDLGCSVFDTSRVAGGFPDILVGKNSKTAMVEIKRNATAPYTEAQKKFMQNWRGSTVCRIHDIEGAINLAKTLEKS